MLNADTIHPARPRQRQFSDHRGFALLITVVLISFLVLIVVTLATTTRIETQVASNSHQVNDSRNQALMALNIALGQLQKYAGPDERITAQANLINTTAANPWFTGVWDSDTTGTTPLIWLVSGNETNPTSITPSTELQRTTGSPDTPLADAANPGRVRLIGPRTSRATPLASANIEQGAVVVPAVAVQSAVPGTTAGTRQVTGRYAYWIGDEGVKASLALTDRSDAVNYAPWGDPKVRARLNQQLGTRPSYTRDADMQSGLSYVRAEGFDPITSTGSLGQGVGQIIDRTQLSLIQSVNTSIPMPTFLKDRYHDFTEVAYSVLANTKGPADTHRGLMQDLSRNPGELGSAFAAYADYSAYMEAPGTTTTGAITALPAITGEDSPRRRYTIKPEVTNAPAGLPEIAFGVAPVLTNFYLQFRIQRPTSGIVEARSRLYVMLWNPFSSALVPPTDLRVTVEGLPSVAVENAPESDGAATAGSITLDLGETPASQGTGVALPFSAASRHATSLANNYGADGEMASWLPGRVYAWTTDKAPAPTSSASSTLGFYSNRLDSSGGTTGWIHPTTSALTGSDNELGIDIPAAELTVKLWSGSRLLSTQTLKYEGDASPDISSDTWAFAYAYRLNQPRTYNTDRQWLQKYDPRSANLTQAAIDDRETFIPFGTTSGTEFTLTDYATSSPQITTSSALGGGDNLVGNLLYRVQGNSARSVSTYNDVSLFELPRLPLLSLGELQHLQLTGRRPYSIGNSWGGTANQVFDRFFFTGLAQAAPAINVPDLSSGQPLPNWNLIPIGSSQLNDILNAPQGESSRYLLQAGGFNINSTSVPAWRAVLSTVRFGTDRPFEVAEIADTAGSDPDAGTQNGTATRIETFDSDSSMGARPAPLFFRFPQSAQEVYFWKDPSPGTTSSNERKFDTAAFRLGVRGYNNSASTAPFAGETGDFTTHSSGGITGTSIQHVTTDQIEILASEIVNRLRTRATTKGPFRNLEEFLSETTEFDGQSLLEDAISASGINATEVQPVSSALHTKDSGLSTLTLTQADLLTATAPYLRVRSDTFCIRTYGEAINPATGETTGKAWAEAIVQRFPETVTDGDSISQPSGAFGRRFKIIKFQWLNESDI